MNHPTPKKTASGTPAFNAAVEAGVLAGISERLAHDGNNLLAGILAVGEDFQFHLEDGRPFPEGMQLLHGKILRTKQLVQRIVELPDKSSPKKHHNLNDLVAEAAELARKFLPQGITVQTDAAPEALPVFADAAALRWLLIELAWTAAAGSPSGKLCLATSRQARSPRPVICLTLTLTGKLQPQDKTRAPKFRHVGRFVEKHGAVFSVVNPGTAFQLELTESDFTEAREA